MCGDQDAMIDMLSIRRRYNTEALKLGLVPILYPSLMRKAVLDYTVLYNGPER